MENFGATSSIFIPKGVRLQVSYDKILLGDILKKKEEDTKIIYWFFNQCLKGIFEQKPR